MVPLGQRYQQTLYLFKKVNGVLQAEPLQPTFFVPMMGRAEEERVVQADAGEPVLVNGDFKNVSGDQPVGWYYVRQGKVETAGRTPGGKCLSFHNDTPGRAAQALQAVGIDGRRTQEIEISLWVRGRNVQAGFAARATAVAWSIAFFNANRQPVGRQGIGPWSGSFDWVEKHLRIKVPAVGPPGQRGSGTVGRDGPNLGGRRGAEGSSPRNAPPPPLRTPSEPAITLDALCPGWYKPRPRGGSSTRPIR